MVREIGNEQHVRTLRKSGSDRSDDGSDDADLRRAILPEPSAATHRVVPTRGHRGFRRANDLRQVGERTQPVNIENRPGASGTIGARSVCATPDGYTLLIGQAAEIAINKISVVDLGYNPERDLQPVALVTIMPMGLVVPTTAPYSTVGELVNASRAAPRGLTFASAGAGTPGHFAGEILRLRTGGRFTHVPFDGAAPALEGLIAGRVDFYFASLLAAQEPVKAGKLKMIAVSSAQRVLAAPTVPTVMESGIPNFNMTQWVTLLAPRGTPKPVVDRLNRRSIRSWRSRKSGSGCSAPAPTSRRCRRTKSGPS